MSNRTHKRSSYLIMLASTLIVMAFLLPVQASANSRFHVQNDSTATVVVNIFNGDDSACMAEGKHKKVHPGENQSMGCAGGGKHRCKIMVTIDKELICTNFNNGCGDTTTIVENHAKFTVSDKDVCTLTQGD